ncbi:MAG: hypothetical protein GX096_01600 [Clostridiales bacterium]|nr:hypothetical protein [Clostridiales bacterium]
MDNQKIDWKRKLTSRKLWVAVTSFIGMLVVALGASEESATQITGILMAGASMIAYIIGEGLVDAQSAGNWDYTETEDPQDTDQNNPS